MHNTKPKIQKTESGSFELSVYTDTLPNERQIAICIKKLQTAFPSMNAGFFNILTERILANKFTTKRIEDATNHVIDNFQYKELNVADVIKFDRRVKLYTGKEFENAQYGGRHHPSEFERREINGVIYFVLKVDLLNENL